MDRLKHLSHVLYLGAGCYGEHIAVKMYRTALKLGFREYFSHSLQHTKAFVTNHQFNPIQTTASQPLEETDPAGFVLLHALGSTKNLTVAVLIYRNRHQNGYILKLSAPVTAQLDSIYVDIWVPSAL